MDYRKRIYDSLLSLKLESFGAALIVGPKGCGKTTTAKEKAKSFIEFQDEDERENLLAVAEVSPSRLLLGEKPRLIDEWQDAPKIWGAVRKSCDDLNENGLYILTGSSSANVDVLHSGTMRISRMEMLPMSLFESGESNGEVSLSKLFSNPQGFESSKSNLAEEQLIFSICRGGWPRAVMNPTPRSQLQIARDLFNQTVQVDISNISKTRRNPNWAKTILQSFSRNICTLAGISTILADARATCQISDSSFYDYVSDLEKLFIVQNVSAWCPAIRSKSAIRAGKKINLIDPSIAAAALGLEPEYFNTDFRTLGFLFESLVIRDLKVYSAALDGELSYYHDRYGLEADAVLHLRNGKYALIEIKYGANKIDEGAEHLLELERLIKEKNQKETQCPLRLPDLKIVITGTEYGYRRNDGVLVIPIGCLRD